MKLRDTNVCISQISRGEKFRWDTKRLQRENEAMCKGISFDRAAAFIRTATQSHINPGQTNHRVRWEDGKTHVGSSNQAFFNSIQGVLGHGWKKRNANNTGDEGRVYKNMVAYNNVKIAIFFTVCTQNGFTKWRANMHHLPLTISIFQSRPQYCSKQFASDCQ